MKSDIDEPLQEHSRTRLSCDLPVTRFRQDVPAARPIHTL